MSKILLLIAIALGFTAEGFLQWRYPQPPASEGVTFAFNEARPTVSPEVARVASFGYSHFLSSLLWVRFLQATPPEKVPEGSRSWIYYDLHTIASLDPDFVPVFAQGALFLSVITEDKLGALDLLERGVKLHAKDWSVLGALAYHYQFELGEPEKAGPLYVEAAKLPGVPWLISVQAASFLAKRDSVEAGVAFLKRLEADTQDEQIKKRIQEKITKLEARGAR
jgi:hypothetical protein